jgi:hypothetical protein
VAAIFLPTLAFAQPGPPITPRLNSPISGQELIVEVQEPRAKQPTQTNPAKPLNAGRTADATASVAGESVYVRLSDLAGEVDGTLELSSTSKEVLVPVFAEAKTRAATVVKETRLRVLLDDIEFSEITPAAAPFAVPGLPPDVKVVWLAATVAPADAARLAEATGTTLRVSYRQPLLHDRFFYLPVIAPGHERASAKRNWPFQMFVRSTDRLLAPPEPPADSQHLGDILVVYLRDRQLVELSIPPRKRPAKNP